MFMKEHRDRWPSKNLFLFAAIGSAVGLGNVWRFPYLAGKYGGGAFLLPFLISLFVIGFPLIIMEFALGQKMQQGVVGAFRKIDKRLSGVGLGSVLVSFGVSAYYAVIMGWCVLYTLYSTTLAWGDDTQSFFFDKVLQLSGSAQMMQGVSLPVLAALFFSWVFVYFSTWKGVKSLSKIVQITMPLPLILLAILFIRGLVFPGAIEGVLFFLTPSFEALLDTQVWMAAISQTFFSLSLGFGVMITYSSYEYKNNDIVKSALITAATDGAVALFAGLTVFSTAGYMAMQDNLPFGELVGSGPSLAFVIFPKALSQVPGAVFFAILFFVMLVTFAIDSLFSLVEVVAALFEDQMPKVRKEMIVFFVCLITFLAGLVFVSTAGIYYLDIADHFFTHYGLVLMGLLQALSVGWIFGAEKLRHYINETTRMKLGPAWDFLIKYLIPAVLATVILLSLLNDIQHPYGDYPAWALWTFGWGLVILMVATAASFSFFQTSYIKDE